MIPDEVPGGSSAPQVLQNTIGGAAELGDEDTSAGSAHQVGAGLGEHPDPLTASKGLEDASECRPRVVTVGEEAMEGHCSGPNTGTDEEGGTMLAGQEARPGKYAGDIRIHLSSGLDGIMGVLVRKQNLKRMGLLEGEGSECSLSPFKSFSKKAIIQEIGKRGKDSDWTEHKAIIKAYPLEEVLLVRDDAGSYGANYLMPFTEIAFRAVHEAITAANADAVTARGEAESKKQQALEMEAKKRLRDENADVPVTPREWKSDTAEVTAAEIEGMTIKAKRPLVKQSFVKKAETLGATASYQPFTDRVLSLKTPKDSLSVDVKQELDFGVQAVPSMRDAWSQAAGDAMKNVEIQHDSNSLIKGAGLPNAASRKSFQAFFSKVASMIEEALQHNETVDILKDSLSHMETFVGSAVQMETEEVLKEAFTFTDLSYSKNKLISFIQWIPESEKLIACAAMEAASFDERVEAPGRSSKKSQHSASSPLPITNCTWLPDYLMDKKCKACPASALLQIAIWDASSLRLQQVTPDATHAGRLQPAVVSSAIDFSHKRPVQHLVPLPSKLDFRRSLAIYFNAQADNAFFISCGADGGVYVWDITAAVAGADNTEFLWRPVLQCQLRKQDPGVLFLGRTDGNLEVWDLRDQLQKPTTLSAVSATQLTSLAFPQLQQQRPRLHQHPSGYGRSKSRKLTRQPPVAEAVAMSSETSPALAYLAIGDATGALRVLKLFPSLTNPNPDELSHISAMLLKDDGRVEYLNEREAVLKKATEEKHKRQAVERDSEEVETPPEGEAESLELEAMEAEYKAMEAAFLKELQQRATQENSTTQPAPCADEKEKNASLAT
ncbi:hypothtetical protein, conserved, putative [Eimeria praecox]|uniref:Hypothtetical protein, conserved, putative n=1 Tax=Eimeria praecox TaxID=51316 RepID=U6H2A5_9EIME|nr:hypothtetical protein, conserved, putative [Eimeria praecox]